MASIGDIDGIRPTGIVSANSYSYETLMTSSVEMGEGGGWLTPTQGELRDEEERLAMRRRCHVGAELMTDFFDQHWKKDGNRNTKVLFVPVMPGGMSDLSKITAEEPADTSEFPGSICFELYTAESWQSRLSSFVQKSTFEMIDMQSDLIMCASIWYDKVYDDVPSTIKIAYVSITLVTFAMEVGSALVFAVRHHEEADHGLVGFHRAKAFFNTFFLNFLSAPVDLIVAPFRLSPPGAHDLGRNIGYSIEQRGPLVLRGETALHKFLDNRNFVTKLPKIFLEDVVLFGLTVHIQKTLLGHWTAVSCFSVVLSLCGLLHSISVGWEWIRDARSAKRFMEKIGDDPEQALSKRTKKFRDKSLKTWPLGCPLL